MDDHVRVDDVADAHARHPVHHPQVDNNVNSHGKQVNMVSQSWDGERVYFTTSLLSKWDKKGEDNDQFLKGYDWDGKELHHRFTIDFNAEKLGRPHMMRFGAASLYAS